MEDTTGLFKDSAYYLKSWWSDEPMVHIVGHWTWPDRVGQPIRIAVDSNAEEVELFLNGKSLGRQTMAREGHLEWQVPYQPGVLVARGYAGGKEIASDKVETTGPAAKLKLEPYRAGLTADGKDATMVKVSVLDAAGRVVPDGDAQVTFAVEGSAHIIGVGNGDPGSHEADRVVDDVTSQPVEGWQIADASPGDAAAGGAGPQWRNPFQWHPPGEGPKTPDAFVLRGVFRQTQAPAPGVKTTLFLPLLNTHQRVFIGSQEVSKGQQRAGDGLSVSLDGVTLPLGEIKVLITVPDQGEAGLKALYQVGNGGTNVAFIQRVIPAAPWTRRAFSGYAQLVLQAGDVAGPVTIKATAPGLQPAQAVIQTTAAR